MWLFISIAIYITQKPNSEKIVGIKLKMKCLCNVENKAYSHNGIRTGIRNIRIVFRFNLFFCPSMIYKCIYIYVLIFMTMVISMHFVSSL